MTNLQDLPTQLTPIIERMITRVNTLSERIANGTIAPDEWRDAMAEAIAEFHQTAAMGGAGIDDIPPELLDVVTRQAGVQVSFLDNFRNDIEATGWTLALAERYSNRARMYATALVAPFAEGDVFKQAGQVLPLPAMPGEGTICHSNCGCNWDIDKLDGANNFDAFWRLNKTDNCQTCLQRAADWSPVQIRDGVLL